MLLAIGFPLWVGAGDAHKPAEKQAARFLHPFPALSAPGRRLVPGQPRAGEPRALQAVCISDLPLRHSSLISDRSINKPFKAYVSTQELFMLNFGMISL